MSDKEQRFRNIFTDLKSIIETHAPHLNADYDHDTGYSLNAGTNPTNNKPMHFAATMIKKNYVSFYLMPVYIEPSLLDDISDDLRKRMQGKSCFNFKQPDEALFQELAALPQRALDDYREKGYLSVD